MARNKETQVIFLYFLDSFAMPTVHVAADSSSISDKEQVPSKWTHFGISGSNRLSPPPSLGSGPYELV